MAMNSTDSFTPDRLLAGTDELITDQGILISGQNTVRGTVLGKIAASGKLTKCVSTATDGSQFPCCIQAADCDAASGDKTVPIYLAGEFTDNAVIFGGTDTAAASPNSVGAVAWAATIAKTANAIVSPTVANGFVYVCSVAGTTGGSQPTWPLIDGNVVVDGSVTWTARKIMTHKDILRNSWGIYLKTPLKA